MLPAIQLYFPAGIHQFGQDHWVKTEVITILGLALSINFMIVGGKRSLSIVIKVLGLALNPTLLTQPQFGTQFGLALNPTLLSGPQFGTQGPWVTTEPHFTD